MKVEFKNMTMLEVIFVSICLFSITITRNYIYTIICILSILPMIIAKKQLTNSDIEIKKGKNFLYGFILVFIVYMVIILYYKYSLNLFNTMNQYTHNQLRLFQLTVTMTIFLGYFFKIRFKDFHWCLTLKGFFIIVMVYFSIEVVPYLIVKDFNSIKLIFKFDFVKSFLQQLYYPSIVEEIIFRGFFFSGLLSLEINEDKSNIIQSIVFGLIHVLNYNEVSIMIILASFLQIYLGFLFGKIFITTKSLTPCIIIHATPCIIIHALIDTM